METKAVLGFQDSISSLTHLLGAVAVIVLLIKLFSSRGVARRYPLPILIYGITCIFLLIMSGVYHLLQRETTSRYVLRILDHAGIFLLIAGTLIAVHEVLFSGLMRWGVILLASAIAVLGIISGYNHYRKCRNSA